MLLWVMITVRSWNPFVLLALSLIVMIVVSITDQISSELRGYQSEYSEDREAHLQSLVEEGRRIRGTIAQYRGKWSFGAWDEGVKFPSLLKNGVLVTEPRH